MKALALFACFLWMPLGMALAGPSQEPPVPSHAALALTMNPVSVRLADTEAPKLPPPALWPTALSADASAQGWSSAAGLIGAGALAWLALFARRRRQHQTNTPPAAQARPGMAVAPAATASLTGFKLMEFEELPLGFDEVDLLEPPSAVPAPAPKTRRLRKRDTSPTRAAVRRRSIPHPNQSMA